MNYHNITHCDTLNGSGIRTTLWVAGCNHYCKNCQNPSTWDVNGGIQFDEEAMTELMQSLSNDYVSGLTLSGGDPMHPNNRDAILQICKTVKNKFPNKNIWMYTGYVFEDIRTHPILQYIDILVDGEYIEEFKNTELHWVGSSNQRIISVPQTFKDNKIITIQN
jgi:anaerobic ribonucleoside-triphosphate reductase activating protein